jgi:hypothetical protein
MIKNSLDLNVSDTAPLASKTEKAISSTYPHEKGPGVGNGKRRQGSRSLQFPIIGILILITLQGLVGNYVNLFAAFPSGPVSASFSGLTQAVQKAGIATAFHAFSGFWIIALAIFVLAISLRLKLTSIRITSIIAFIFVVSALAGGLQFVFSGFSNNGFSAQMSTSFIVAYAFYFSELYFTKGLDHMNHNVGVIS